jgi:hypothetical protein
MILASHVRNNTTVGAKSMARAKSMAPDHTANDIMQIKQKY